MGSRPFALVFACALFLGSAGLAPPATAQSQPETLADIRQELSVLFVEIQRLRSELSTTGAAAGSGGAGSTIDRVNAIEAALQRLTARTEQLELRIDAVVRDGTNQIGDLEFRLCELEPNCDLASLGDTPTLGGVAPTTAAPAPSAPASGITSGALPDLGGANLAVAEEADFTRARDAFDGGNYADAAALFSTFTETYPGSPLSAEAHYLRGEAEANQARWSPAARAFLDAFSADITGPRAPSALTALGVSLAQLGQTDEACITLGEVANRFPGNPSVSEAQAERARLGCP